MSACDVFVLSSDYEGLPTVLIEAMACQANVVSTDVSGVREIVNIYGEIIETNNPEQLYLALLKALNIQGKNESGSLYVKEKFNLDIIVREWQDIYYKG